MGNYNIDIKRTFVGFAQQFFKEHTKYTWNIDPTTTKILILDKYSINLKVIEKKRSIVVSRGAYGWKYTSLGQRSTTETRSIFDEQRGTDRTDLIRGSMTYNCISREGLVAEEIAHILFAGITGFKEQFGKNGIHQLMNINIGEESILKSDSNIELTAVPVFVQFETRKNIKQGFDFYTFFVEDGAGDRFYQGTDFEISAAGITFYKPAASGAILTATYIHAITLDEIKETLIGAVDGVNTFYTVSSPIFTAYPLWSGTTLTVSGIAW